MKKAESRKKLECIEEALDRIACSLASISGVLDSIYAEVMEEKKEEERLKKKREDVMREDANKQLDAMQRRLVFEDKVNNSKELGK